MSVVTYEGRVEQGQIRLKDAVALPEGAQVYVVVTPQLRPGTPWARELYEMFAPARAEAARCSEAEVDDDIDAAVAAVRGRHA